MSFASETKNELSRLEVGKECCNLAEIAGFIRVAGSIGLAGKGKFNIVLKTENAAVARRYKKIIKEYFQVDAKLDMEESGNLNKGYHYLLKISPGMQSEQILRETGILLVKQGNNFISDGIYEGIVKSKCCKKAFLRGAFMGCGTINNPEKGYNLEWITNSKKFAQDLVKIVDSFVDLKAKTIKRKNHYVVYVKNSSYIRDLLAIMGAHSKLLELENVKITKELKSEAVRMTNCDTANMDRVLDASERQIAEIKLIEAKKGMGWLPEKLRAVALCRLANPEASLVQLGEMIDPPLKKSGVNNRLKKISELAGKIR